MVIVDYAFAFFMFSCGVSIIVFSVGLVTKLFKS